MCNICKIRLPQAIGDVISNIRIGTAAANSIGYQAPERYRSNPTMDNSYILHHYMWIGLL